MGTSPSSKARELASFIDDEPGNRTNFDELLQFSTNIAQSSQFKVELPKFYEELSLVDWVYDKKDTL